MQLASIDDITRQYRHVYFQPHFDDAALSCGGSIGLQTATGQRVLIVTVFGGAPAAETPPSAFAEQVQQKMGLGGKPSDAVAARGAEDLAAAEALHADVLWLNYPDAIYRGSPAFYASEESLFGEVHSGDLKLDEELSNVFLKIAERAPVAVLYAPLGVGHHVDHQLCCSAADRLAQRKLNVKFYEDFPYVTQNSALDSRKKELSIAMEPELVEISGTMAIKRAAIEAYSSQIPVLFGTPTVLAETLDRYSGSLRPTEPGIRIERYWRW